MDAHTIGVGTLVHNIDLRAHSLTASVDYGLTDKLALSLSLPYVISRYRGPIPHAGSIVDDGNYHGAVSDADVELRYKAIDGTVVVTPYIGALWPTRNYGTLGHATPGKGLTEYSLGLESGHRANWLLPGLVLGAGYAYSFVEKVHDDISVNRSNLDFRLSWYATSKWSLHTATSWQQTHGGLNIPLSPHDARDHSQHHDQMLRADFWRVGAGVAYALSPSTDVFGGWSTSITSQNAHAVRAVSLGVGWNFARRR